MRKSLCAIGIHKWKQVRTYSAVGVRTCDPFFGIPCRDHFPWHGVEKCSRCGKRVKGRKDSFDISFMVVSVLFFVAAIVVIIPVVVILGQFLWTCLIDLWRLAFQ